MPLLYFPPCSTSLLGSYFVVAAQEALAKKKRIAQNLLSSRKEKESARGSSLTLLSPDLASAPKKQPPASSKAAVKEKLAAGVDPKVKAHCVPNATPEPTEDVPRSIVVTPLPEGWTEVEAIASPVGKSTKHLDDCDLTESDSDIGEDLGLEEEDEDMGYTDKESPNPDPKKWISLADHKKLDEANEKRWNALIAAEKARTQSAENALMRAAAELGEAQEGNTTSPDLVLATKLNAAIAAKEEMEKKLAELKTASTQQGKRVKTLEQQLKNAKEDLKQRQGTSTTSQDTSAKDVTDLKKDNQKLSKDLVQAKKDTQTVSKELKSTEKDLTKAQKEVERLKKKDDDASTTTGSSKNSSRSANTLKRLKDKNTELTAEKATLTTENTDLKKRNQELVKKLELAKSVLQKAQKVLPEEVKDGIKNPARQYLKDYVFRTKKIVSASTENSDNDEVKHLTKKIYNGIKADLELEKGGANELEYEEFHRIYKTEMTSYHSNLRSQTQTSCMRAAFGTYS